MFKRPWVRILSPDSGKTFFTFVVNIDFLNGPTPASFLFILCLFKQTIQFLHQINVKKYHDHPVYSTGIRAHNLSDMSRLP